VVDTGIVFLFFFELFVSALFYIFRLTPFETGWVDWAYEPNDPNGPFGWMIANNVWIKEGELNGDPINDRLIRYESPPYRVVKIFHYPMKCCSEYGHTYIRVIMYQKPEHGGPKEKIRTFDSSLFKRVSPPIYKK